MISHLSLGNRVSNQLLQLRRVLVLVHAGVRAVPRKLASLAHRQVREVFPLLRDVSGNPLGIQLREGLSVVRDLARLLGVLVQLGTPGEDLMSGKAKYSVLRHSYDLASWTNFDFCYKHKWSCPMAIFAPSDGPDLRPTSPGLRSSGQV